MLEEQKLREIGVSQFGTLPTTEIGFYEEIRHFAKKTPAVCMALPGPAPPAVGTVAQCKERCLRYQTALVFNAVYPLEDSFDYEGMIEGHAAFKRLCDALYLLVKEQYSSFLLLSNEGCTRCKSCTYPNHACRYPEKLFPSLEGYGIQVNRLAESAESPIAMAKTPSPILVASVLKFPIYKKKTACTS